MSKLKQRMWIRNTFFALTQPFIPPSGILSIVFHEMAHWLTAFFIGVPISEIKIRFYLINPAVAIPKSIPPEYVPYFFYSGGITSGTILLIFYVFYWAKKYYHNPSATNWIMSVIIIFSAAIQIYFGILEGTYHESYGTHINTYYVLMICAIVFACHTAIFYFLNRWRIKKFRN